MINVEKLTQINHEASQIAESIKILGPLSWSSTAELEFMAGWEKGQVVLPKVTYQKLDYEPQRLQLKKLLKSFKAHHPLEIYTKKSIESCIQAAELVEAAGTQRMQEISIEAFGRPGSQIPGSLVTNVDAAKSLLEIVDNFSHPYIKEPELCVPANQIKAYLEKAVRERFMKEGPAIYIVDTLTAKATASAKYVKLRGGTCFSIYDYDQLLHHEIMIHSLTALNGLRQPILKLMGRTSLRTTSTQEGLATFSEVITGSIDLNRLKRIALRILAIDMALKGASFVEVVRFFLEKGQALKESYLATSRIFRGGYPDKNIVFTKDCVYLDGLIRIHMLFKWALKNGKLGILHLLFCGRVAIEDLFILEPSLEANHIIQPQFIPPWYERIEGLAGILSFSFLSNALHMSEIEDYYSKSWELVA